MSWPILTQDDLTTDNRDMAVGDITFTDILIEEKVHVSDEYLPKGRHFFEGWQTQKRPSFAYDALSPTIDQWTSRGLML